MSEVSVKDRLIELLLNPDNDHKGKADLAAELGVDRKTMWRHEKEIDWEWLKAERRRLYSREIIELDKALLKKAKGGDVRAIEIGYQRFDGWVPTQGVHMNRDATDSDIEAEMRKIMAQQQENTDGSRTCETQKPS